ETQEGALGLVGLHGEAAVEVGDERGGEVGIGGGVIGDAGDAQLLGEAALEGAEGAFTAAAGFRRAAAGVPEARGLERAGDLRVVRVVGRSAGGGRAAEVA